MERIIPLIKDDKFGRREYNTKSNVKWKGLVALAEQLLVRSILPCHVGTLS
jgi:hypothetical protein